MRIRQPPTQLLLTGWFVALALIIAGPLLGAGHLMFLDFVGGPRVPPFSFNAELVVVEFHGERHHGPPGLHCGEKEGHASS